jgi:metal-dependent amidase/aminoacylase/carboxypeptidase family protein
MPFLIALCTSGKAAHGGQPDLGINAIDQMVKLVERFRSALHRQHPLMGKDTLNLGIIAGGEKVNMVPDICTSHLDLRMCAPGTVEEYEKEGRNFPASSEPPEELMTRVRARWRDYGF